MPANRISAQDIGFFGVSTDKDSGKGSEGGVASGMATNSGDEEGEEITDRDGVEDETIDCDIAGFDFFACRMRICS